jgi:phage tail-like protein
MVARNDPFRVFRFLVEIDSVQRGGFARVKGMSRETKVEARREGGVNDYEHKLATMTSYGNVVLERGLADDYLLRWHQDVIDGKVERRTVTIVVYDETGTRETWRWLVERAYPVKWTGTDLDAASGAVLVESVELTHHGFRRA